MAQIFQDTTLNFDNPADLILKANSGTKGISIADYNGDGFLDIYFVVKEETKDSDLSSRSRLFQFDGETYFDKTSEAGRGAAGFTSLVQSQYDFKLGASWGDYNNDGYPDLFLANSGLDMLLKNNGDDTFTNITSTAGVGGRSTAVSTQGLWFDYDKDGDLDLYVSVLVDQNFDADNKANIMYENIGNDEFENVSFESGLSDSGYTWTSLALDVNGDSHLDLYAANDFGPNKFYINNGDKTFTEQTSAYKLQDNGNGMGLAIGDPNLDGLFDFYLTNITELDDQPDNNNRLFIQTKDSGFVKREFEAKVNKAGWGWGTDFFDFDNDGDEDLIVANGFRIESGKQFNRLFRNYYVATGSLQFSEISEEAGFVIEEDSFVNTVFDQNNDGFLDIFTSHTFLKPQFYLNKLSEGNWIKIWLEGVDTNRNGFGSVIKIEADTATYYRYYHGAGLHTQHVLPVHFGLGEHPMIDKITVYWLNGRIDEIDQIPVNQTIRVKEFEGIVQTSTEEEIDSDPASFQLLGNYPNPFNGGTTITFKLNSSSFISLKIYNSIGQLVHANSAKYNTGTHRYTWNPGILNSGVYFYKITDQDGLTQSSRMIYMK